MRRVERSPPHGTPRRASHGANGGSGNCQPIASELVQEAKLNPARSATCHDVSGQPLKNMLLRWVAIGAAAAFMTGFTSCGTPRAATSTSPSVAAVSPAHPQGSPLPENLTFAGTLNGTMTAGIAGATCGGGVMGYEGEVQGSVPGTPGLVRVRIGVVGLFPGPGTYSNNSKHGVADVLVDDGIGTSALSPQQFGRGAQSVITVSVSTDLISGTVSATKLVRSTDTGSSAAMPADLSVSGSWRCK